MKAYVFGAGAHGRVVADILRAAGLASIAFVDDNPALRGREVNGIPIAGSLEEVARGWDAESGIVIALGNPVLRLKIAARAASMGVTFFNAIHPSAAIAPTAALGTGSMIGAGAVINSNARVGDHVIVNTAAVVEHDTSLEDGSTICPRASLGGRTTIARGAFIGSGANLLPRIRVGEFAVVAAASLVTKSVDDRTLVLGAPARVRETITESFEWSRLL